jgi:hypothetical protein
VASPEAKEFYFFVRHLHLSPESYAQLTEIQKQALIYQWNEEQKAEERRQKQIGTRRKKR